MNPWPLFYFQLILQIFQIMSCFISWSRQEATSLDIPIIITSSMHMHHSFNHIFIFHVKLHNSKKITSQQRGGRQMWAYCILSLHITIILVLSFLLCVIYLIWGTSHTNSWSTVQEVHGSVFDIFVLAILNQELLQR